MESRRPKFPRPNLNPVYLPRLNVKGGGRPGNWDGMIDRTDTPPINPDGILSDDLLKKELRKYSDLCQVTKDNFKYKADAGDPIGLPNCLNPSKLLAKKDLWLIPEDSAAHDYSIPNDDKFYLLASSGIYPGESRFFDDVTTNWIGYVAIDKTQPEGQWDIAVVFRGTEATTEWYSDIQAEMVQWSDLQKIPRHAGWRGWLPRLKHAMFGEAGVIMVAKGFEEMYRSFTSTPGNSISLQGQVHVAVHKLLAAYPKKIGSITTTGHSLGGALASMCAFDIAWSRINKDGDEQKGDYIPVTAFTFEAPRVGNKEYAAQFDKCLDKTPKDEKPDFVDVKMFRVVNKSDIVPQVPDRSIALRTFKLWRLPKYVLFGLRGAIGILLYRERWEANKVYFPGGTEYLVDSRPLEELACPEGPLINYTHDYNLFHIGDWARQRHNMQLAMHLVDPCREFTNDSMHNPPEAAAADKEQAKPSAAHPTAREL